MKPIRQLYLGMGLAYCVGLALFFFSQLITLDYFALLGAGFTVSIVTQIIRTCKNGDSLPQLIPAIVIMLVCLSQVAGLFVLGYAPVIGSSPAFLFYLITTLVNMALSAVGFFLK